MGESYRDITAQTTIAVLKRGCIIDTDLPADIAGCIAVQEQLATLIKAWLCGEVQLKKSKAEPRTRGGNFSGRYAGRSGKR